MSGGYNLRSCGLRRLGRGARAADAQLKVIFLVLVCIATAALFVWLVVGRATLGSDRGGLAVSGGPSMSAGTAVAEKAKPGTPTADGAPAPAAAEPSWVRHDVEVEELVRERLYGDQRRRR